MKILQTERNKGIIALIILSFVFASMGVFVRYLQIDFTILQQTYLRVFAAFLFGCIIFYKDIDLKKITKISKKEWSILLLRSVAMYLIAVTLISEAYTLSKYSNVSFVAALPLTAVFGFILLKEKITLQKILYILLGFLGVVLIGVSDYSNILIWQKGELFALIASVFFALSYIARKWQGNILNNKEIAVMIFFISTCLLCITSFLFGESFPSANSFSSVTIAVIILAGLFNVVNLFLTNYGFQKVNAVLASNLLMLEVIFAVGLGFFLYQEIPTIKEFIGGLLIVGSAYQMNKLS